jgi:hypothetical protein
MPIAKEVHEHQMEENKSKNNSNPSALEEEPHLLPTNELNWPTLSGNTSKKYGEENEDRLSESSDEWEHISSSGTLVSKIIEETTKVPIINRKSIHRCASTPEFSNLKDENSYVLECSDDNVEAQSKSTVAGAVLLSYVTDTSMRRVPSFKDIIMLNAQSREEDEKKKKELLQQNQNKMREEALKKRKANRPKLVVSPIKRCTQSTGNLRSLVIHEDQEEDTYGGGGGAIIHENEVLGDSDATEFYDRKKKGSLNRHNGSKFRPDEAKRKDMIIHKKNAQRKAQEGRVSSADKK